MEYLGGKGNCTKYSLSVRDIQSFVNVIDNNKGKCVINL